MFKLVCIQLLLSHFSHVRLCATPQTAAYQAPHPWDSPGKNSGVGCHFLLPCMKVTSESEVAQSCLTLSDSMDCSLPGSSVHGFSRQEYWSGLPFPSPSKRSMYMLNVDACSRNGRTKKYLKITRRQIYTRNLWPGILVPVSFHQSRCVSGLRNMLEIA